MVEAFAQSPQVRMVPNDTLWARANEAAAALVDPAGWAMPASFKVLRSQVLSEASEACPSGGVSVMNRLEAVLMSCVLSR